MRIPANGHTAHRVKELFFRAASANFQETVYGGGRDGYGNVTPRGNPPMYFRYSVTGGVRPL